MGRRKKPNLKTRFELLSVEFGKEDVNPETGNIEISLEFNMIDRTSRVINSSTGIAFDNKGLSLGYMGENKWRTTTAMPSEPGDHSHDLISKVQKYKHIVAIDTNMSCFYSSHFDKQLNIGLGIAIVMFLDGDKYELHPITRPFITTINPEKPENENWVRVIELLRKSCQCTDPRKIAIIVDSDLGNLDQYNKRTKPVIENYFLPEEYELVFASDKVKDNVFNIMIGQCHALSRDLLPDFINNLKNFKA